MPLKLTLCVWNNAGLGFVEVLFCWDWL